LIPMVIVMLKPFFFTRVYRADTQADHVFKV